MSEFAPTSPNLPADSGIVKTEKQFSDSLTQDLTDEEIKQALALLLPIKKKWETRLLVRSPTTETSTSMKPWIL